MRITKLINLKSITLKNIKVMSDYTKEQGFWNRLEIFCKGVTITNAMQEEEKEMILNICKEKKKEVVLSKKSINGK